MLTFLESKDFNIASDNVHLPPRPHKIPGRTMNEAKKLREEEQKRESELRIRDDEKRKKRKEELKSELSKLKEKK